MSITRETVLSSLTSGGTANINVAGNTQITGALIATIDENGNDLGQLTLNTGSLSFTDLTNIHQSNQTSGSISTSIGLGGQSGTEAAQQIPTAQDGQGRDSRFNTTNIAYSNNSQYDAEKSLATLGSGNINVGGVQLELNGELTDAGKAEGSPLDRLNRDTTNLNKDLWSVERSEGNIDLQIDHRMFSEEGRKEIAEDFKRTEILGESIADMTQDSVSFLGNGDGESSLREHIGNKQDYFTATKNFVNNKDNEAHVATLGNADATPAEKQAAYTALVNTIATQMGVDPTQAKILLDADPDFAGAFSKDTNLIYLNDLAHDSAGQAVNTLGHETQHHIDNQRNPNVSGSEQYSNNRENYAGIMGNATEDYLNFNFATGGYSLAGSNNHEMGSNAQERRDNLGLGLRNAVSFNSEDKSALDYRPLKGNETSRLDEVVDGIRNQPLRPEYQSQQIDNLVAEACARTECANGIPVSDPHYVKLKELEAKGKALIDDGQTYLANEDDLFKYGRMDKINDFLRREDEIVTRVEGGAIAITGTYGAVTAGAAAVGTSPACSTGVGCLAPVGLAGLSVLSADAAHDGWQKAVGDYSSPFGQEVINNFGTGTAQDPSNPLFDLGLGLATELGLYGVGRYADQISDGIDGTIRYVSPTGKQVGDDLGSYGENASKSKKLNYSSTFTDDLVNFNPGYQHFSGQLDNDLTLVQFHRSDRELGEGRSAAWWTNTEQGNTLQTIDDVRQNLALPPAWGPRDAVSIAKIPKGSNVEFFEGTAARQNSNGVVFEGDGLQFRFKEFDQNWIIDTRKIPGVTDE